jgi:hypothetical protein
MRTDPTDTGGLFIRRRPGTAPVRYRALPQPGTARRRRFDSLLAGALLVAMTCVAVSFWGPLPAAWLWVGSQIDYRTDSVSLGIFAAFLGLLFSLLGGLMAMRRLDDAWILVRRAAGHDQRQGAMARIFAVSVAIGAIIFTIWLLLFAGLGPTLAPRQ